MRPAVRFFLLALLASSHGVNDFIAGWMLGGNMPGNSSWDRLPWLVIYAVLAFAGQLPVAWIIERSPRTDRWMMRVLAGMALAVAIWRWNPGCAIILSGVASAFCHVAGGAIALHLPRGERAIGWFSAPGVVGLALGGWLGHSGQELAWWAAALPVALFAGCFCLRARWPRTPAAESTVPAPAFDAHDGIMLLILLALTLRSALWDLVQVAASADPYTIFAIALSAGCGKVLGGWLVSRWPGVRQVSVTLLAACLLLEVARQSVVALCAGVALLQSTIPASIVILHRSFGTTAARAAAYVLGLTVALGGLVLPLRSLGFAEVTAAVAAAALALFYFSARPRRLNRGIPAG
jgi:FSR family fosmidomycin resistance protein-like MFS transporter